MDIRSPNRPLMGIQDYFDRKGLISDKGKKKRAFKLLRNADEENVRECRGKGNLIEDEHWNRREEI